MKARDIYKTGYSFAKNQHEKRQRVLIYVSLGVPVLIFLVLAWGFISGADWFVRKSTQVTPIVTQVEDDEEERIAAEKAREDTYAAAGVPYVDPDGRFRIIFMDAWVSGRIGVVIYSEKDYDKTRAEAEDVIARIQQQVPIDSISYINAFEE